MNQRQTARAEWERIKAQTPPKRLPERKAVDAMMDGENEEIREMRKRRMTTSATFSLELAVGLTPSVSPDGPTTGPCGPEVVHASLSARQAKELGLLTSGTCGQPGSISSASAALERSLVSRLRAATGAPGTLDACKASVKAHALAHLKPKPRSIYDLPPATRRTAVAKARKQLTKRGMRYVSLKDL